MSTLSAKLSYLPITYLRRRLFRRHSAFPLTSSGLSMDTKLATGMQRAQFSSTHLTSPLSVHAKCTTRFTSNTTTVTSNNNFASDLIVVLDMDECLIHSEFLQNASNDYRQYEADRLAQSQASSRDHYLNPSSCESFRISLADGDVVNINKRPNLDFFLRKITERYETYIFTAAMEVYASPVLDNLDPEGQMFQGRFYRDMCIFDESLGVYVKDLRSAFDKKISHSNGKKHPSDENTEERPFNSKRIVLVDNNPYSFLANPSNGILVSNFYDDSNDDTLLSVIDLLCELEPVDDVRPVLDSKFGLKEALKEITGKVYRPRY